MLRVACVLKMGGDYGPQQVAALRAGVRRWLTLPHEFVCLTDHPAVEADVVLPLERGWPGWWSKIELFDQFRTGDTLYFDLDTIITGPLNGLALGHRFTVLENFWSADRIGSGMMAWRGNLSPLFQKFVMRPEHYMREYRTTERWGDQGFIFRHTPVPLDRWQRLQPGRVVSFKLHCRKVGRVPEGAAVVCFHGKPRPWSMSATERAWFGTSGNARSLPERLHVAGS